VTRAKGGNRSSRSHASDSKCIGAHSSAVRKQPAQRKKSTIGGIEHVVEG
jgi:hypothetical protein